MDSHHSLSREGNVSSTSLSKRELVYGDGLSDFYVFVVSCERTQGTSAVGRRETSVLVEALRLRQFFSNGCLTRAQKERTLGLTTQWQFCLENQLARGSHSRPW